MLYLTNSTRDFQTLIDSINVEEVWENNEKPKNVAWEIKGASSGKPRLKDTGDNLVKPVEEKEKVLEWQVVKSRSKRRKSQSSNDCGSDEGAPKEARLCKKPINVYDRLTYGQKTTRTSSVPYNSQAPVVNEFKGNGITSGKLLTPKSAMDLPQTKASMAKIAYSR